MYISLFIMPYPVLLSLIPSLFLSLFFFLTPFIRLIYPGMIQDIIFRVIPSISFFIILPSCCISFLFILVSLSRCCSSSVDCRRAKLSPSCSVDRPPSSRHTLLYGASLSSAFPCPIASYKAITLCLHPSCPSVVSFRPPGCVCPSAFLLPRLVTCLHYVYIYQSDFDY